MPPEAGGIATVATGQKKEEVFYECAPSPG